MENNIDNTQPDDRWIRSSCSICYGGCSIRVRRQNGIVTKIEGDPESPVGAGRLCAKGASAMMMLYDPNRLNKPLKRTNPEKGIGVDPGWQEVSWDEALDIVAEKLREAREKDPRTLFYQGTTTSDHAKKFGGTAFTLAFGSPNICSAGGGLHCGDGAHFMGGLMHASWSLLPDYAHCEYAIYFGASKGHSAGHIACATAQQASDARSRGMKIVVVDPMCGSAASKAAEWVPIRVGTDGALALAMINVLLNDLGIYDAKYLKTFTNAPYLIGPDGLYARDTATGKPLLWDLAAGQPRVYDDEGLADPALEGEFDVGGVVARPGFALVREHVRKYTPELASEITTVPADTIRRMARDFGTAARVGSTIVLDGKTLPLRPACAIFFRGAQGHKNSVYTCMAIDLLNHIVGAADVPGGVLGFNPVSFGHPETGRPRFAPGVGPDGLMKVGVWVDRHPPYPPNRVKPAESMALKEVFPLGRTPGFFASADQEELWKTFGLPYRPQVMINYGANSVMSVGNAQTVAASLKKIPFIVSFDIFLTEFSDFADIVLPDASYLERLDPSPNFPPILYHTGGPGEWVWGLRQPAVEPSESRRSFVPVMLELAERIGMREDMNATLNVLMDLSGEWRLDPEKKYTWEEMSDRMLKDNFGPERGLEWFKEHGILKWPKQVAEVYWRPFTKARVPFYFEFFKVALEEVRKVAEKYDFPIDLSRYEPLPEWTPCPSHQVRSPEFDLWAFYYRDVLHANSFTMENPWLDEASHMNPYSYTIAINADTGRKKGIRDGDEIAVESTTGRKIKGKVKLTEGMHPEGLGVASCAGHWSPYQPIARGKGVFFNELLELDWAHTDPVNMSLDLCVKVKISKV